MPLAYTRNKGRILRSPVGKHVACRRMNLTGHVKSVAGGCGADAYVAGAGDTNKFGYSCPKRQAPRVADRIKIYVALRAGVRLLLNSGGG